MFIYLLLFGFEEGYLIAICLSFQNVSMLDLSKVLEHLLVNCIPDYYT
jgi:hypothetical protein